DAADSGSRLQDVLSRGRLVAGIQSDYPPFCYKDDSGDIVGFDVDICRLLAKGLFGDGAKLDIRVVTADARIPSVVIGDDDVSSTLTITTQRAQQVEFTDCYYRSGTGFLLPAGGKYKDFAGLKAGGADVTVSALQNVMIADWVHAALPQARVE